MEEDAKGIRYEGTYKQGLKNGTFTETDKEGKLIRKINYKMGRLDLNNK